MKYLTLIITVLLFASSCKKGTVTNCFNNTGEIINQEREIESFKNILLKDNVNLILKKSETTSIRVEAGSNIISGIVTDVVKNGVLEIRNDNSCNWIRSFDSPINVYLNYVDIDTLEYRSIGDITTIDTIITDSLWINVMEGAGQIKMNLDVVRLYCSLHYGTADIILSGKCGLSYIYSASFGLIDLIDLNTDLVYVNNRSSNDIYLNAKIHLGATIENIGNIYYTGNPETISFDKIGEGELIKLLN